jgi:hypothetical protein
MSPPKRGSVLRDGELSDKKFKARRAEKVLFLPPSQRFKYKFNLYNIYYET